MLSRAALGCLLLSLGACSLGNIDNDACDTDSQCASAFGLGSACIEGFCSAAVTCATGHDCRARVGGGACVEARCVAALPADPVGACTVFEPDDLEGQSLVGDEAPVLVGGMFLYDASFSPPILDSVRLATREINDSGGLGDGHNLGVVLCDNGGSDNALLDDERRARIRTVVDYLAGTLGVTFLVGPLTSGDSQTAVQHVVSSGYPTVMISPSATSPALTNEPDKLDEDDLLGLFWRSAPSDELQGQVLADNVAGVFPMAGAIGKVAAPYRDDAYGLGLADAFQKSFTPSETTLQKFDIDAELTTAATAAAGANPDAVLFIDIDPERATGFAAAMDAEPALSGKPLYLADGSKGDQLFDAALPQNVKDIMFNLTVGTVAAAPAGPAFNTFQSSYLSEFEADPANFSFTANGYDALYLGAAALVYARNESALYDGRDIAEGLSHLISGTSVAVGKLSWSTVRNELTSGDKNIDIEGVSGPLDFDTATGQAPAAIEIWKPSNLAADCDGAPPCFVVLDVIDP